MHFASRRNQEAGAGLARPLCCLVTLPVAMKKKGLRECCLLLCGLVRLALVVDAPYPETGQCFSKTRNVVCMHLFETPACAPKKVSGESPTLRLSFPEPFFYL